MFVEPLTGFCYVNARERRTKIDWALEVAALAKQFSHAKKIILVCGLAVLSVILARYLKRKAESAQ
jgi:hypothetical protein